MFFEEVLDGNWLVWFVSYSGMLVGILEDFIVVLESIINFVVYVIIKVVCIIV